MIDGCYVRRMLCMVKYPASRTRGLIKMDVLTEGEENRPHRIRAVTEIHEWLAALTATERGELLAGAYATHQKAQEAQAQAAPSWVDLGPLGALKKLTLPQRPIVEALAAGAKLYRLGRYGPYVLRDPDGTERSANANVVNALLRRGGNAPVSEVPVRKLRRKDS